MREALEAERLSQQILRNLGLFLAATLVLMTAVAVTN
jgi:hypothetical protein